MRAGQYADEEELTELDRRRFPLYVARFGEREAAHLERSRETRNAEATRAFFQVAAASFDLRPRLGAITASTLVLAGHSDFVAGPVAARELTAGIRAARLALVEECGHYPFVEAPDRFRAEVLRFLQFP